MTDAKNPENKPPPPPTGLIIAYVVGGIVTLIIVVFGIIKFIATIRSKINKSNPFDRILSAK